MKYNCKLNIYANNELRDDALVGQCDEMPTLNKCFVMFRESNRFKEVSTSPIKSISRDGWNFTVTDESGYKYHISLK